ncbi:ABC-type xenobiotic transporter [Ascochyta rabiei]|uniref:ABC-type xenobiotic transporter n=1 Tax=Didymella rabiei TaxID=5454 RepID=UPI0022039D10|nr:ABC-type xenobiotic transporter [Ascochyta rabiei]UPX10227.1 ABC-type xenobiotic transporter [Ascochyta rabiei]
MSPVGKPGRSPPSRNSENEKKGAGSVDDDIKPDDAQGGKGPWADKTSWLLDSIAFSAAIAADTLLPIMDLVFEKLVTAFNGFAVGTIGPAGYRFQVNNYTLYFVYLFVAKFALVYIHSVLISIAAIRATWAPRIDLSKHILRQNIAYFDSDAAASVTVQATTNGNSVNDDISEKLTLTIHGVSTFVSAFIVAFIIQWKLTLITIGIVLTIFIVTGICVGIDTKNGAQLLPIYSKAGLIAEKVFATVRTVHSFRLNPLLSKRYDKLLGDAMEVGMKKSPNLAVLFLPELFCVYCGYGLAFWQGIRRYQSGEISEVGDVFTVTIAVIFAATAMTQIAPQILALEAGFSRRLRRLEFKLEEETGERFARSAALAAEAVSAIRTLSSLALENSMMFWYFLSQSVSFLAMALGFWYGGRLISYYEYTITKFFTMFIAVVFSEEAAAAFFSYTTSLIRTTTAAN